MDLFDAVLNNDVAAVRKLLEQGADPNLIIDEAKLTPLHFAAQNNALEIASLLITAGAKIDSESEPDGQTPLDIAQIYKHQEIINLFTAML